MRSPTHRHGTPPRDGVLLANLGTPTAPTPKAVRRFLREFLSDRRVVEIPRLLWRPLLHLLIAPLRAPRTARAYSTIWQPHDDDGSPLLIHSRRQQRALAEQFKARGLDLACELAMTYGEPSPATALGRLAEQNVARLVVLPLYPQYSASTTAAVFDRIAAALEQHRRLPSLTLVGDYCDDDGYIKACAERIQAYRDKHGAGERLLLSFHGLPERNLAAGDPYHCQCRKTARLIAERLGLADTQWTTTFQSRFGRAEWLKPYTDDTLAELARDGRSVDVFTPGFAADCLETLEEINLRSRDHYLACGGTRFRYIPALNDAPAHIEALAQIVLRHAPERFGAPADAAEWRASRDRALALGAKD